MEENQKIPMRSQVKKEDTWAIEDMYATVEDWEKDFAAAKKVAEEAAEYAGRLGESAQALYDWSVLTEKLDCMLSEIYGYASRVKDQDTADAAGQTLSARAMGLYVECSGLISFADPEILSIPEEKLEAFYAEKPELLKYRRSINEVRRCKDHILSPELEKILADAGEMAQAPGTVYSSLVNADLTFDPIKGSNEEELEVTGGSFIPLMQSPDRNVRKAAFESLYGGYGKVLNTAAGLPNASCQFPLTNLYSLPSRTEAADKMARSMLCAVILRSLKKVTEVLTQPTWKDSPSIISWPRPITHSVEAPPISTISRVSSEGGSAKLQPWNTSLASSLPRRISTLQSRIFSARSMNSCEFFAALSV